MFSDQKPQSSAYADSLSFPQERLKQSSTALLVVLGMIFCVLPSFGKRASKLLYIDGKDRVRKTVAEQPAWPVPVATPPVGTRTARTFCSAIRQVTLNPH